MRTASYCALVWSFCATGFAIEFDLTQNKIAGLNVMQNYESEIDEAAGIYLVQIIRVSQTSYGVFDCYWPFEDLEEAAFRFIHRWGLSQGEGCKAGNSSCIAQILVEDIRASLPTSDVAETLRASSDRPGENWTLVAPAVIPIYVFDKLFGSTYHIWTCNFAATTVAKTICEQMADSKLFGGDLNGSDDGQDVNEGCLEQFEEALNRLLQRLKISRDAMKPPWRKFAFSDPTQGSGNVMKFETSLGLTLPWYFMRGGEHRYGVQSCIESVARDMCGMISQQSFNGLCPCIDDIQKFLLPRETRESKVWQLDTEEAIRQAFTRLTKGQCVFPTAGLNVTQKEIDEAAGFPRAFWEILEQPFHGSIEGHKKRFNITGIASDVSCVTNGDDPIRVWFNITDMVYEGKSDVNTRAGNGGFFDFPGLDYTSLARMMDTSGCASRCVVVEDSSKATFLVSQHYPAAKSGHITQHTVHMTLEAKDYTPAPQNFDIAMDLSPYANVPLLLVPVSFWERMLKLPIPTLEDISTRRLALWVASNCCRTTWDRLGFVMEVEKSLQRLNDMKGPAIECLGGCIHNVPSQAHGLRSHWSEGLLKGCDNKSSICSEDDVLGAENTKATFGRYLFVFSLVNNVENTNIDEKFFDPFLSNAVPIVVAPRRANRHSPHRQGQHESYIDATKFQSPEALARYLIWLQENPAEYLKFFEYRSQAAFEEFRQAPSQDSGSDVGLFDSVGVFSPGTLCRLCSCTCDPACMKKREVGVCGYAHAA